MGHAFADVENGLQLRVGVLGHDLERSEQLSGQQLELPRRLEVLDGHEDGRGHPRAVAARDGVVLQRGASKQNLGTVQLEHGIQVSLDLLVVPGEDWANGEVFVGAFGRLLSDFFEQTSLAPVAVHEHD